MGGGEGENEHAVAGWEEEEEEEDKGARVKGWVSRERERERRETRNVVEGVSDARRKAANTRGRGTPGEKREEGAGRRRGGGVWIEK